MTDRDLIERVVRIGVGAVTALELSGLFQRGYIETSNGFRLTERGQALLDAEPPHCPESGESVADCDHLVDLSEVELGGEG